MSLAFRPVHPVECTLPSVSFLLALPPPLSISRDSPRLSPSRFQSPASSFNGHGGDFSPPTSGTLSAPASRRVTLVVSPFLARQNSPPTRDPRPFPLRLYTAPNLNPIFHITSRKSYSAALGGAGNNATQAPRTKERRNIFIFSLPLSRPLRVPFLSYTARSKTISEHIARVRLRSPF